ncbi:MAG: hypothetical protein MH321_16370 [Leptospiraceae bacterium]|nr:hypothetical protein [Leptospiraceae bacterium]
MIPEPKPDIQSTILPKLHNSIVQKILPNLNTISKDRFSILNSIAYELKNMVGNLGVAKINFICTHNSRRSHLSQILFHTALVFYKMDHISTYSGGTEATALNDRVVIALEDFGYRLEKVQPNQFNQSHNFQENPVYEIYLSKITKPILAFSKKYQDDPNPKSDFLAIMTCDHASENCPVVFGASSKINLNYTDPKASDGNPDEKLVYTNKLIEIGIEMFALGKLLS